MKNKKTLFLTEAAMIAAIYTVLVLIFQPISFGPVQFRIAEMLTVLPFFTPAAIPGVSIGCFLSAVLTAADILDMIFGSLATLIAAILSYKLRRYKYLIPVPPIVVNAMIIPWVLKYAYFEEKSVPFMVLTVGAGQLIVVGIIGMSFLLLLEKLKLPIFKKE
jgi:uncharacterized membrane protein